MSFEQKRLDEVVNIFHHLFGKKEHVRLCYGADEPFYQAAMNEQPAVIYSRSNFLSSALHEIAHWCLAGKERRALDDFGYWYFPEGRSKEQQMAFESVEVKPQAIECLLSLACGHPFKVSLDDFSQHSHREDFEKRVLHQAYLYYHKGLPQDAQSLFDQLMAAFWDNQQPTCPVLTFFKQQQKQLLEQEQQLNQKQRLDQEQEHLSMKPVILKGLIQEGLTCCA